jgi:acetyl CoA:N6-hydroxylysine acetyl transferase
LRPAKPLPSTPLYSRLIPHLNSHFKLAVVGPNDIPLLHNWLNDDRVDEFWEERGTLEQHEKFVAERTADAHVVPVIGSCVDTTAEGEMAREPEPATYSEIYWVKEDRLGPLMDVRDYDRGERSLLICRREGLS